MTDQPAYAQLRKMVRMATADAWTAPSVVDERTQKLYDALLAEAGIRDAARTATARQTGQQPEPTVAYGDGKGRVYCRTCASAADTDVPLAVGHIDHWETCGSCGRYVVDVARQQPTPAAGLDASQPATDPLNADERQFLTFAIDLADNRMANRSDEFTPEDYEALARFRRMAEEGR
ncbi:hypothetical protein [Streptomyces sp. CC208A]|uniref:hypothetical protein n=1 Tax=Streptomyces sp. CC208A TaxID=3044573 RepID=UPI0024A93B3B|nr:hypothetical protein [Streptomyces sp. CC208A]